MKKSEAQKAWFMSRWHGVGTQVNIWLTTLCCSSNEKSIVMQHNKCLLILFAHSFNNLVEPEISSFLLLFKASLITEALHLHLSNQIVVACHMSSQVKGRKTCWCLVHTDERQHLFPTTSPCCFLSFSLHYKKGKLPHVLTTQRGKRLATY